MLSSQYPWKRAFRIGISILLYVVLAYSAVLMLGITLDYIPWHTDGAFLAIKQTEVTHYTYYLPIFYTHVLTSIFVLLAGSTQFSQWLLRRYPRWHRSMGYVYVLLILCFAAPSGLVMGYHANGNIISQCSFMVLAVLWWIFTYVALQRIRQRQVLQHQQFMIRSFALTLSALTLRWWKVILMHSWDMAPMDMYVWISLLGWIPNILIAEMIIIRKYHLYLSSKF